MIYNLLIGRGNSKAMHKQACNQEFCKAEEVS